MLEATRCFARACFPDEHFGRRAGDLILRGALYVGTVEGKPMTQSALARYAGIPRPSVIRKLKSLQRAGVVVKVGDGFALSADAMHSAAAIDAAEAAAKALRRPGR
jgi:DNA-binding IclR family transcriptional regulator